MAEQARSLWLAAPDLAAAQAAVETAIDDLVVRGEAVDSAAGIGLAALHQQLAQAPAPARLRLTGSQAELLRACVTGVMARQGYFVGRPEGMARLVDLRRRLDALLGSGAPLRR